MSGKCRDIVELVEVAELVGALVDDVDAAELVVASAPLDEEVRDPLLVRADDSSRAEGGGSERVVRSTALVVVGTNTPVLIPTLLHSNNPPTTTSRLPLRTPSND